MNRVAARPGQLGTDIAIGAFADQLNALFTNIDELRVWAATVIAQNLTALGCQGDHDVLLVDYLAAAQDASLSPQAAFASLITRIADRSGAAPWPA